MHYIMHSQSVYHEMACSRGARIRTHIRFVKQSPHNVRIPPRIACDQDDQMGRSPPDEASVELSGVVKIPPEDDLVHGGSHVQG